MPVECQNIPSPHLWSQQMPRQQNVISVTGEAQKIHTGVKKAGKLYCNQCCETAFWLVVGKKPTLTTKGPSNLIERPNHCKAVLLNKHLDAGGLLETFVESRLQGPANTFVSLRTRSSSDREECFLCHYFRRRDLQVASCKNWDMQVHHLQYEEIW
jgi:hypothetical protein